jgi:ADP-heptose:LPS heptosyltransferase
MNRSPVDSDVGSNAPSAGYMKYFRHLVGLMRGNKMPGRGNKILRNLDKYVGVPLVFGLGMMRRRRHLPETIRRIALLNTAAIGDTILMSAPLADLRSAYRNAEICLLVGPSNYEAACLLSLADFVVKLSVFDPIGAILQIRKLKLDLLLDFGPWARLNAVLAALSQAKFIAGFRTSGQHRHYSYDLAVDHLGNTHELENYRRLVSKLDLGCRHRPRIDIEQILSNRDHPITNPYLVFHLWPGGTGSKLKQWPVERWVKLAEHFLDSGYRIVLTGAPSQKSDNDAVIDAISPARRGRVYNCAHSSLAATAALLLCARLVVSVDTGVMHMAAALEVPLVALMGPACRRRWGPVSASASVLESPLTGCGYLNLGFEIPRDPPKCMERILFEDVLGLCKDALLQGSRPPVWFRRVRA